MAEGNTAFSSTLLDFLNRGRESETELKPDNRPGRTGRMNLSDVLTTVCGKPITVEDVLVFLKATGTFRNAIYHMISIEVLMLKAQEMQVTLREHEVHAYCKAKKEGLGIQDAAAMNDYCKWLGITYEHWLKQVEIELIREKLKQALFPEAKIRELFAEHHQSLRTYSLSRIVGDDPDRLTAFRRQVEAGEADFSALARGHSLEQNTRVAGGFLGRIKPGMLNPELEKHLFAASANELVGPIAQDGRWALYRVDDVQEPEFTEQLKEQIAERLFVDWLENEVRIVPA